MSKGNQMQVYVVDGELRISIGIALLAFAVQNGPQWPEDWYVSDIDVFAKEIARQLDRESEDGTTDVHRMLDAAAIEVMEQGGDGFDEGDVQRGIRLAEAAMKETK